jgi:DNA invertase Pin-like site-specific DNA recombinase
MSQVRSHHESQRLQYQLAERARELGWSEPVIIDDDLGRSGSGSTTRPGFLQLLGAVCAKKVGAIFCLESSRLARNNREWYELIDFCASVNTLLIDLDGIYDPGNVSDRVYLGMKGTMSEYELGIFRQRAQSAILEKAKRGELYSHLGAGCIVTPDNRCEKHPDERIQSAITLVFTKFRQFASANQVVQWLRSEGIKMPVRPRGRALNTIVWKKPTRSTITGILKNPFYAGAYVFGRRETRTTFVDGKPVKTGGHDLPMEKWKVLIKDHHEAYISWDEFMAIQRQLPQNRNKFDAATKGAPKGGPALLTGLLRCQKCGRKFEVRYKGKNSQTSSYACRGEDAVGRRGRCLRFYGTQLEARVAEEVLRVVEPAAISFAEEAHRLYQQKRSEKEQTFLKALAQAEYEANRCFEQYNQADPRNRIVAQTLENRWEQALKEVGRVKQNLEHVRETEQPLSQHEWQSLYQLAEDVPRVWHHQKADIRIKKRILQILIKEIMVNIDSDNHFIFSIHWSGGKHTQYRIKRRTRGERQSFLHPETEAVIRELAEVAPDREIARILNLLKYKTATDKTWIAARVAAFRQKHKIPAFSPNEYAKKGLVNLTEAAEILGLNTMAVSRLIKANVIKGRQVVRYAPWVIEKEHLKETTVRKAVAALKKGKKIPLTKKSESQIRLTL